MFREGLHWQAFSRCHYLYDGAGRLRDVLLPGGGSAQYGYGADGLRSSKTVNGVVTAFHSLDGNVILELDGAGLVTARNVFAGGLQFRQTESGVYSAVKDFHGDILALADESGHLTGQSSFDPFGNSLKLPEPAFGAQASVSLWREEADGIDCPFGYAGEYTDAETGLVYLRARYYDPAAGRFTQEDPIRDGYNWYAFCGNNPVNRWDPSGRAWTSEDKSNYDRLISQNQKAEAESFKKTIDTATINYEKAQADMDLFAMNDARYSAVQARQRVYKNGYEDTFDYTHGRKELIFLGVHEVSPAGNIGTGNYHASVLVFVSSESEYYEHKDFGNEAYGGKVHYATLGAGGKNGKLVSEPNRKKMSSWILRYR